MRMGPNDDGFGLNGQMVCGNQGLKRTWGDSSWQTRDETRNIGMFIAQDSRFHPRADLRRKADSFPGRVWQDVVTSLKSIYLEGFFHRT